MSFPATTTGDTLKETFVGRVASPNECVMRMEPLLRFVIADGHVFSTPIFLCALESK